MSYFQIDSTLLVFSSVTHMPPSPTASLTILVHKRSPFSEISKSQKSEHDTFCVKPRKAYRPVLSRPQSSLACAVCLRLCIGVKLREQQVEWSL